MIAADKKEYRKGFNRHLISCQLLSDKNIYSRRLLLFYSIECGLKYLLMDRWGIMNTEEIQSDKEKMSILGSHNLNALLKELGQGMIKFSIKTCHKDAVDITTYHQVCRYGIGAVSKDVHKEKLLESNLQEIAQWIKNERM